MRSRIRPNDLYSPDKILSNLINDYINGKLSDNKVLHRAIVLAVDSSGGQLEDSPPNPKNTIRAKIVDSMIHSHLNDSSCPVFWPMFPHDVMPIKESEHVYVVFEDEKRMHGVWFCRIPESATYNNLNVAAATEKYNSLNPEINAKSTPDESVHNAKLTLSDEFQKEKIPDNFDFRVGDRVIEGSNDALIVLGRDRVSTKDSGVKELAGSIDLIVGRNSNNFNRKEDKSVISISQNTEADKNFEVKVGDDSGPSAFITTKSDQIRIIARNGMKIIVEGGEIIIDAESIKIGNSADNSSVLGDSLKKYLETVVVNTPAGPGKLTPMTEAQNYLSKKSKVE